MTRPDRKTMIERLVNNRINNDEDGDLLENILIYGCTGYWNYTDDQLWDEYQTLNNDDEEE